MVTSPDGSRLLNNQWGILFDAQGNNWRVVNGEVYENGADTHNGGGAQELDYIGGKIWEELPNSATAPGVWRVWTGQYFGGPNAGYPTSPRAAPYPPGMNEYQATNAAWDDPRSWSQFAPDNYRNTYSEIKTGTVFLRPYEWHDGNNFWLNGGSMWLEPGDAFGSYMTIQAGMVTPDESGHDYVNVLEQAEGTTQSWASIGAVGPVGLRSGSEQLKLNIEHGAFVNNGVMYASGSRAELDITARSQYPGWSGDFYNNNFMWLDESKTKIDAPMHGNGTINLDYSSHLTMIAPDDAGVFNLQHASILEFGPPTMSFLFMGETVPATRPSVQFGGTINLWGEGAGTIMLDDVTGVGLEVTHPSGALTHVNVLDDTHGVLASLNFGNTMGVLNDNGFTLGHQGNNTTLNYNPHTA